MDLALILKDPPLLFFIFKKCRFKMDSLLLFMQDHFFFIDSHFLYLEVKAYFYHLIVKLELTKLSFTLFILLFCFLQLLLSLFDPLFYFLPLFLPLQFSLPLSILPLQIFFVPKIHSYHISKYLYL